MSQNIGLSVGRKGRRMIQPPGESNNMFLDGVDNSVSSPDAPLRSHRTHNAHMTSSIFQGENYKDPGETTSQFRTITEHSKSSTPTTPSTSSRSSTPSTPFRLSKSSTPTNPETGNCYREAPPTSDGYMNKPQFSSRFSEGGDEACDSRYPITNPSLYRKQTDESVESMFSHSTVPVQQKAKGFFSEKDRNFVSKMDFAPDAGARGAALNNKINQNHRGFNLLTGQSNFEEETSKKFEKDTNSRQQEKDDLSRVSRDRRPPAGLVAGGKVNHYVRGQTHDSGPLW